TRGARRRFRAGMPPGINTRCPEEDPTAISLRCRPFTHGLSPATIRLSGLLGKAPARASVDDLSNFVSDTEEHASRLIANDPDNAGPCVEATLRAMLTGAFDDLNLSSDE
ncbi:MAG: hypothetical protein WBO21_12780, partial [Acidimicrobiia bacterium]